MKILLARDCSEKAINNTIHKTFVVEEYVMLRYIPINEYNDFRAFKVNVSMCKIDQCARF